MLKWFTIVIVVVALVFIRPSTSAAFVFELGTSKPTYNAAETLEINGNISNSGSPVSDGLVLIQIDNPKNSVWVIRTLTTGQTPDGPFPVEVLNVTTTDSNGRPKDLFNRGEDAGFKVAIRNNMGSPYMVNVTVNLYYSNGVPFKLFTIYNATIDGGQTVVRSTWPVNIPANASAGQATAYACVFSNLPNETGIAYAPERTGTFKIVMAGGGYTPATSPSGTFNFTIPLLLIPPWLGNYTIHATTYYSPTLRPGSATFTVILAGDLNHDRKVDMKDIAIVAKAFGTRPGDPLWNLVADLNHDGKVDMKDVAIVGKEFGMAPL
jgi:hypothetical protein